MTPVPRGRRPPIGGAVVVRRRETAGPCPLRGRDDTATPCARGRDPATSSHHAPPTPTPIIISPSSEAVVPARQRSGQPSAASIASATLHRRLAVATRTPRAAPTPPTHSPRPSCVTPTPRRRAHLLALRPSGVTTPHATPPQAACHLVIVHHPAPSPVCRVC